MHTNRNFKPACRLLWKEPDVRGVTCVGTLNVDMYALKTESNAFEFTICSKFMLFTSHQMN